MRYCDHPDKQETIHQSFRKRERDIQSFTIKQNQEHPRVSGSGNNPCVDELSQVDHVPSNAQSSPGQSKLYIFKDNEAVIKIAIESRSPTLSNVSRTHRVALDWLFGRINFDPKIQIRCVDTKNQLADILTKSSFSKDEWNNLLRSLYIMNLSMFSRSYFSHSVSDPTRNQESMSKRGQDKCLTCLTVRIVGVKRVALQQHWAILKFGESNDTNVWCKTSGNRNGTRATLSGVLKREHRKMLRAQRPGNRKRLFLLTIASGNGSEQWTQPTQKWNTVIWQLNVTVISRKSSRSYNKSW